MQLSAERLARFANGVFAVLRVLDHVGGCCTAIGGANEIERHAVSPRVWWPRHAILPRPWSGAEKSRSNFSREGPHRNRLSLPLNLRCAIGPSATKGRYVEAGDNRGFDRCM